MNVQAMRRWLRRRLGVRLRSALAAVLVVAVVLAVAAGAFLLLHHQALVAVADTAATDRATALADQVATGDQSGIDQMLVTAPADSTVIQVIDASGTVLSASSDARGEPRGGAPISELRPVSKLRPAPGQVQRQDRRLPGFGEDPFRIVALGVAGPDGSRVVLVARSLAPAYESTETELTLVLVGYPLLLVAVGAATALFVGRSLRAVEAVRRQVAGITARHLYERVPVPEARDEVWQLANTMNAMLDRLEAAAAAQRRFIADASHELRSPLTTLRVGLEIHSGRFPAGPLLEEAERLQGLVDDLLLLARVDERGLAPRYTDVDLDDLVDGEHRRLATHEKLTVGVAVSPVRVRGDARQLGRAVRNLVDNAVRHADEAVSLRVWQDGALAHIEVANDGPEIPVEERERIFDRFVRLDESRAGSGSGLGLAIVREIAEGHLGTVAVVDGPRTTFRLSIPVDPPADSPGASLGTSSGASSGTSSSASSSASSRSGQAGTSR